MQAFEFESDAGSGSKELPFSGMHWPGSRRTAVVFLHGWLMSPQIWDSIAAQISGAGYPCYAVWQPGHGPVPSPTSGFAMQSWAEWLEAGLARLDADQYVLVGHSMGGILALEFLAHHRARVGGIALVGSSAAAWQQDHADMLIETARQVSAGWSPDAAHALAPFLTGARFLENNAEWVEGWAIDVQGYDVGGHLTLAEAFAQRGDHSAVLAGYDGPAMVIHGEADLGLPPAAAQYAASLADSIDLVLMPECGHCPPLEEPEATGNALLGWLQGTAHP